MSAAILESEGWSRSQWVGALCVIVLLHALGLFIFSEGEATVRPVTPRLSNIYFVDDPGSDSRLAESLSLQDPMVFVRMDPDSFSRVNFPATSHFSYELTNWTEPYLWLAPSDQYFADDFNLYVASAVRPSTLLTEKVLPVLREVAFSAPVFPSHALLRIEGDLAGRRLISNFPLPVNETSAILTNTVLRIVVDSAGETLWAALIFGSGWTKADQSALAWAKKARFERVTEPGNGVRSANGGAFKLGQFVFQWFPLAVSATNQLTAKP